MSGLVANNRSAADWLINRRAWIGVHSASTINVAIALRVGIKDCLFLAACVWTIGLDALLIGAQRLVVGGLILEGAATHEKKERKKNNSLHLPSYHAEVVA